MFIDEALVRVKAGDGGSGCVSFRREKYVPRGGPDGGDGGDGGSIILKSSSSVRTLLKLRYKSVLRAENGKAGRGSKKTGHKGADLTIVVPLGTIIKEAQTRQVLGDLKAEADLFVAAQGGRGGRGNARFATSTNQSPRYAEKGTAGEERHLYLELKLIADIGLIGLPNAGKSTLISKISAAKPRIADYPFTTLHPNLGMVMTDDYQTFSVADIPGLIHGAHQGIGLGDRFLRHIERSRLLIHLIDVSRTNPADPVESFQTIFEEMKLYSQKLAQKKQIIVANKIDSPSEEKLQALEHFCQEKGYPFSKISAVTGENTKGLIRMVWQMLSKLDR